MGERLGQTINPVDYYTDAISSAIPSDIMTRAAEIVASHRPEYANGLEPLCMLNAKVFIAEDDPEWEEIYRRILERDGHKVLLTATKRAEALDAVEKLTELGINLALIDGNLKKDDDSGADGQAVLSAIRTKAPGVITIGVSGLSVPGADQQVSKGKIENLGEVIREL